MDRPFLFMRAPSGYTPTRSANTARISILKGAAKKYENRKRITTSERMPPAEIFSSNDRRIDHIQTKSIRAIFLHNRKRIRIVLQPLAHLTSVFGQNESIDYDVTKGRSIE